MTVRAKTAAPAHAITQLSPSNTTFWFSPRMDPSDPAGKTFVTSPIEGMSGSEPGCSGPGISRSPKTTGYVSSPTAAMSVMLAPGITCNWVWSNSSFPASSCSKERVAVHPHPACAHRSAAAHARAGDRSAGADGPALGVNLCGRRGGSLARAACDQARHRPLEQWNGFDRQLDAAVAKGFGQAFRRVHKRRTAVAMAE